MNPAIEAASRRVRPWSVSMGMQLAIKPEIPVEKSKKEPVAEETAAEEVAVEEETASETEVASEEKVED